MAQGSAAGPDAAAVPAVGFWEVLALACELALLAAAAVVGWLGPDATAARIALAVVLPAFVVAIWGMWMAPRSAHRLPTPWRQLVQALMFALAGAGLAAVGHPGWGVAVGTTGVLDVAVLAVRERRADAAG